MNPAKLLEHLTKIILLHVVWYLADKHFNRVWIGLLQTVLDHPEIKNTSPIIFIVSDI